MNFKETENFYKKICKMIEKKGDELMNLEDLKGNESLEDFYNILCRNKPHKKSKLFAKWDYLESIAYEELLIEDERIIECNRIIDEIIDFLKEQKKIY